MDKLARELRDDANRIRAEVSPELDYRIQASLRGVEPVAPKKPAATTRSPLFWLASSLTGIAASLGLVFVLNTGQPPATEQVAGQDMAALQLPELPALPLKVEQAMTTSPLERELSNVRSDLKKARDAVTEDVEGLYPAEKP